MFANMLALAQGGPRFDGDTVLVLIVALVIGAVLLVAWASRPSVAARYRRDDVQPPAPHEPGD